MLSHVDAYLFRNSCRVIKAKLDSQSIDPEVKKAVYAELDSMVHVLDNNEQKQN